MEIDPETEALFNLCQDMIFFTRGVFDPTALPLIKLWNWKAQPPVAPDEAVRAAKALVGWSKVQRRKGAIFLPRAGMMMDLGGIGKEYAVDRVLTMGIAAWHRETSWLISARTCAFTASAGTGKVVDRPRRPASSRQVLDGGGREQPSAWPPPAITSGILFTQGRRFGHIIDPRAGYPVNNGVLSVSVVAPHCTFAGILSTAAFVLGPREGMEMMGLCPGC